MDLRYVHPDMTEEKLNNILLLFKQKVLAPARLAGGILLVQETLDQVKENRRAWVYNNSWGDVAVHKNRVAEFHFSDSAMIGAGNTFAA